MSTKRFIIMGDRTLRILATTLIAAAFCLSCQDDSVKQGVYNTLPQFERSVFLVNGTDTLAPSHLELFNDTIYVSYDAQPRIDLYDLDLNLLDSILLTDPEPVIPTNFVRSDSELFVVNHVIGVVAIYDLNGKLIASFGKMPGGEERLLPHAAEYHGGVLYVSDFGQSKVLAISMTDAGDITERGELILTIPADEKRSLGLPTALMVTLDGRMLIGDSRNGKIDVFTCDGRHIYQFDSVGGERQIAPRDFAVDNIRNPEVQDSSTWDPSGVRTHGRTHVVDANNGRVLMFSTFGKYVNSYPEDNSLGRPTSIIIDRKHDRIYIADPRSRRILIYTYERITIG